MSEEKSDNNVSENGNEIVKLEKLIIQSDPKVFEGISKEKRQQIIRSFVFSMHKTHSGPLPDLETLSGYSTLIPNGADRVMIMAEEQMKHRMFLEKKHLSGQLFQSNLGQIFAFIIGIFAIGVSGYCIMNGHDWAGGFLGVGGLTGLVTAFIQGKKSQARNLEAKKPSKKN